MKITFLGTGSMVPTSERNHTSILLSYKNENILGIEIINASKRISKDFLSSIKVENLV